MNPEQKAEAIAELDRIQALTVSISHEAFEGLDPTVRGALACAFRDVRTVSYIWAHDLNAEAVSNAAYGFVMGFKNLDPQGIVNLAQLPEDELAGTVDYLTANAEHRADALMREIWRIFREIFSNPDTHEKAEAEPVHA